jgi:hypothetical protein
MPAHKRLDEGEAVGGLVGGRYSRGNAIRGGCMSMAASTHSAAIAVRADPLVNDAHGEERLG